MPAKPPPTIRTRLRASHDSSMAGISASVRTDASGSASCAGVGSSGASPRSTQTVRIPAVLAGRTS